MMNCLALALWVSLLCIYTCTCI